MCRPKEGKEGKERRVGNEARGYVTGVMYVQDRGRVRGRSGGVAKTGLGYNAVGGVGVQD